VCLKIHSDVSRDRSELTVIRGEMSSCSSIRTSPKQLDRIRDCRRNSPDSRSPVRDRDGDREIPQGDTRAKNNHRGLCVNLGFHQEKNKDTRLSRGASDESVRLGYCLRKNQSTPICSMRFGRAVLAELKRLFVRSGPRRHGCEPLSMAIAIIRLDRRR